MMFSAVRHLSMGNSQRGTTYVETYGLTSYYRDGALHREGDKPAKEYADGSVEYYKDGVLHRDGDKPAIVHTNGTREWWWEGRRHRTNGLPAVKCSATGKDSFFIHGRKYDASDGTILLARAIADVS